MAILEAHNHFKGFEARLWCYTISHRMVVLQFKDRKSGQTLFLKCGFCTSLPQELEWCVDRLDVNELSENNMSITDARAGVSFFCAQVRWTTEIDPEELFG